jgi:hypothetical protein
VSLIETNSGKLMGRDRVSRWKNLEGKKVDESKGDKVVGGSGFFLQNRGTVRFMD